MIKAIIFDCFGVLTVDTWLEFVATLDVAIQNEARYLNHVLDSGEISQQEFYQRVHKLTGAPKTEIEKAIQSFRNKNVPLLKCINDLKSHYKIGMLSNISDHRIKNEWFTKEELSLFDEIVLSCDIKIAKPDVRAYQIIAQKLGLNPQQCIMVDDSLSNCHGAEDAGMKAILYKDFESFKKELKSILK